MLWTIVAGFVFFEIGMRLKSSSFVGSDESARPAPRRLFSLNTFVEKQHLTFFSVFKGCGIECHSVRFFLGWIAQAAGVKCLMVTHLDDTLLHPGGHLPRVSRDRGVC